MARDGAGLRSVLWLQQVAIRYTDRSRIWTAQIHPTPQVD